MTPDDFRRLVSAGLSTDQIAIVMEMMDRDAKAYAAADEARKAKGRDRVQRWRASRNVTETQPNVTVRLTRVEDKTLTTVIEPQVKKVRACRLPTDFSPDLVWAQGQGLSPSQAQTEAAKFRDYWSSKGSNATKTDWPATWRNWVRQSVERLPRGSPHQRPPTAADLAADLLRQMEQPDASTASEIEGHSTSLVRFPRVASG